jgi:hypothetical protein
MPPKRDAAEYWVVHELKPPAGERWEVVDTAHYFSIYARGQETFYAVRRIHEVPASPVNPATVNPAPANPAPVNPAAGSRSGPNS